MEVDDLASNCESVSKSKLSFEKTLRSCEDQLAEAQRKIEEQERMIAELNTEKDRIFQVFILNRAWQTVLDLTYVRVCSKMYEIVLVRPILAKISKKGEIFV